MIKKIQKKIFSKKIFFKKIFPKIFFQKVPFWGQQKYHFGASEKVPFWGQRNLAGTEIYVKDTV